MIAALFLLACARGPGPQVATGEGVACAVFRRGELGCFGEDLALQDTPRGKYRQVSVGEATACALSDGGNIRCWGESFDITTAVPSGFFLAIALGKDHVCALEGDGTVLCWGNDSWGETEAPPLSYLAVAAGGDTSCAILQNQSLTCWGGTDQNLTTPPEGRFSTLAMSSSQGCAIDNEGALQCWPTPATAYSGLITEEIAEVSVGPGAVCTRTAEGRASCATASGPSAELVPPTQTFTSVAAGDGFACGFVDGKDLVCWGDDDAFAGQTKPYEPRDKDGGPDWQDTGDLGEN